MPDGWEIETVAELAPLLQEETIESLDQTERKMQIGMQMEMACKIYVNISGVS